MLQTGDDNKEADDDDEEEEEGEKDDGSGDCDVKMQKSIAADLFPVVCRCEGILLFIDLSMKWVLWSKSYDIMVGGDSGRS